MLDAYTRSSMQDKAAAFLDIQNQYFCDLKTDADMTEYTTQPFWQSMYLSKKRLKEKGLIAETTVKNSNRRMFFHSDTSTAHSQIGNFTRSIKEHKKIYSKNRLIYSKTDDKVISASAIKAQGDGRFADCPNCGHTGEISSYIDGCDYCGSKFTVKDFEEKISSFTLTENTPKKVLHTFKYIGIVIALLLGFLTVTAVVSIILAVVFAMQQGPTKYETYSVIALIASFELLPIFGNIFLISGFIFIAILILAYKFLKARIVNPALPQNHIATFVPEDFAQHLEYKLRNIHFASKAEEVNVYATFDFTEIISRYESVIECTLSQLKFSNVAKIQNKYYIDTDINCTLTKYHNNRVWTENEKLSLTLSAPLTLEDKSFGSITCYHCPNCASTISLLNGGVCEYCGTKLDYSNYSWMIEKYECKGKAMNPFTKIKWLLLAIYFGLFLIISGISIWKNYPTVYQITHYKECVQVCSEEYASILTVDKVVDGVMFAELENNDMKYVYTFQCSPELATEDALSLYMDYLYTEGYSIKEKNSSSVLLFRKISRPEFYLEGHSELDIEFDKDSGVITVTYQIDDSPYEDD